MFCAILTLPLFFFLLFLRYFSHTGASHVEAGQVSAASSRVVRLVSEIRCHRQVVRVDRQR